SLAWRLTWHCLRQHLSTLVRDGDLARHSTTECAVMAVHASLQRRNCRRRRNIGVRSGSREYCPCRSRSFGGVTLTRGSGRLSSSSRSRVPRRHRCPARASQTRRCCHVPVVPHDHGGRGRICVPYDTLG